MRAIVVNKPREVASIEKEVPPVQPDTALVRIRRIGICGTDYHAFLGNQPYFEYPRILGHELAGEIAQIGANAEGFKVGDAVTVIPYLECKSCIACRRGTPNACVNLKVMGVHIDGGMQEYAAVPIDHLVRIEGLTLEQAVIVEPMAIGAHAVNRADIKPGEQVLVIGAGPIGLGVMKFAKLAGAEVIALDINPHKLAFARDWAGADATVSGDSDVVRELSRCTGGDLPTVVFDATGNRQSMNNTFAYAGHTAKIVFVSLVHGEIAFSDPDFHRKELTLLASRGATRREFDDVMRAIRAGHLDAAGYVTHKYPFDQGKEAIEACLRGDNALLKAVLEL